MNANLLFIVLSFAVHRVTRIITTDAIFIRVRDFFLKKSSVKFVKQDFQGRITDEQLRLKKVLPWSWFHELVNCNWCTSVWVGFVASIIFYRHLGWLDTIALALALSSISSIVSEHL
jgi:hypothetical protein